MAEIRGLATGGERCFKEAVLLNANRVYDSCSDKDCLSELQVYFTETAGNVIDNSSFVRFKDAECINVCMNVEAVPFNKGFYSVELTYYFEITLEACTSPSSPATTVKGLAVASKRVILYGGEGGVRVFTSLENPTSCGCNSTEVGGSLPRVTVQVAKPLGLGVKLVECCKPCCPCPCPCNMTPELTARYGGEGFVNNCQKMVLVTLGVFSIVQMERDVQVLVPAYDYELPEQCSEDGGGEDPCDIFDKVKFPVNEFIPPRLKED